MDVTIENFEDVLNEFDEVIKTAAFFSIDSEFTGLNTDRNVPYESPSSFYKRLCTSSNEYIIIQLGITAFRLSTDDPEKFTYKSYNFYVYPQARDQVFKCLGTSVTFLAEQKFDFNKLFRSGISCCNREVAQKLRTQMEERQRHRENLNNAESGVAGVTVAEQVPVPPEELETLEQIRQDIKDFLEKSDKDNIIVGSCNAFQRKLIYQMICNEFANEISTTGQTIDKNKVIVVERKLTDEQQANLLQEKNDKDEEEVRRLVGMSMLMEKISESKKLIVGHNMFLDLFYLIRQFFEPLPESLLSFKKRVHKIFPNLLDTKHVCTERFRTQITSSVLKHVFDTVSKEPFSLPTIEPESPEYGYKDEKEHEAGYDSLMTGICFLALARELHVKNEDINAKSQHLRNFLNKIFVMRLTDIFFINLTGNEPTPNRDHVFHITFPDNWKQSDVVNHFRKYGSIFIRWLNNTSAYIALNNRENSTILLKTITWKKGVKVISYDTYMKQLEAARPSSPTNNSSPANKRKASTEDETENSTIIERPLKKTKSNETEETPVSTKAEDKMFDENDEWPATQ